MLGMKESFISLYRKKLNISLVHHYVASSILISRSHADKMGHIAA
jgi:hypothetical protein